MYLLLIFIAIIVSGVAAELLTRWLLRLQNHYYVWPPYYRMEMHLNSTFLPRMAPRVRFYVNSHGERGDELPRGGGRVFRILVAGGSPAECALLDQEDSWPMRLQTLLNAPDILDTFGLPQVHVGNIAKSGMDAQALDVVLEHGLKTFSNLDLIVIMVGGSNILNWLKAGAPERQEYQRPTPDKFFAWQPVGPFGWSPRRTALAEMARRVRQRLMRPLLVRHGVGKSLNAARLMRLNALELRSSTPDPKFMLQNFETAFRSALVRAQRHANRVLVVRQPWFEKEQFTPEEEAQFWNGSVGDPYSGKVTTFYSHGVLFDLRRRIDQTSVRVCNEIGVEHIEVQSVLEPSVVNYYDHIHFTPAGAVVIAQEIARFLVGSHSTSKEFPELHVRAAGQRAKAVQFSVGNPDSGVLAEKGQPAS